MVEKIFGPWTRTQTITFFGLVTLVLLRCLLFTVISPQPELVNYYGDSQQYREFGEALANGSAFQWTADDPLDLKRTIGYPLLIAANAELFGLNYLYLVALQLLFSGAIALFLYIYLLPHAGTAIAAIAAILYLGDPLTLAFSLQMMTENSFTFAVLLAFIFLLQWKKRAQSRFLILSGISLGIACLIRPIGQVLIALWMLAVAAILPEVRASFRDFFLWKRVKNLLFFLLPVVLLLAPWVIRNAIVWDCPSISLISRHNLRDYIAAGVLADVQKVPIENTVAQLVEIDPGYCPKGSMIYYRILWEHPLAYMKLAGVGTLNTFGFSGDMIALWLGALGIDYVPPDLWQPYTTGGLKEVLRVLMAELGKSPQLTLGVVSLILYQLVIYALALAGLLDWRVRSRETNLEILFALGIVLMLMLTPGVVGDARFRVPAQPFLACFAGFGITWLAARIRHKPESARSS